MALGTGKGRMPKIPETGKGSPEDYKKILDYGIKHECSHRLQLFRVWEQCRLYLQGHQWLQQDKERFSGGEFSGRSPFWKPREVNENSWYPMPVQNEMVAPIQNETARLYGAGSRAYVRPKSSDAQVEKAAKLATDVLADLLEKLRWAEKEHLACADSTAYGTMIVKSQWELDFTDTVTLPKETSVRCAVCGSKLAKLEYNELEATSADPTLRAAMAESVRVEPTTLRSVSSFTVTQCPQCQSEALLPYTATDPKENDLFGVPLSGPVPKGDIAIRVVSPYDFFPDNDGVATHPDEIETFWEEHVESLDWIRKHYARGFEVKPESGEALYRWHQGGISGFTSGSAADMGLFENHALVREFHKKPWVEADENGNRKLNRGRSIVMANGVVLLDGDYLIESKLNPGQFIPRVEYNYTSWEPRDRELFGIGAAELILSLQDIVNTTLSQVEDTRHRHGSPKIMAEEGTDIQFSGVLDTGYQSDVLTYRRSPGGEAPTLFGNVQMAGNWVSEVNMSIEAIPRIIGTMDVEIGQAPKNLSAASAIMYLGEKAAERRKSRVMRYKAVKIRVYRHALMLAHEFYREDRFYSVRGRNDQWEVRAFKGSDLMGQYDVWFDDEPYFDLRMFRREVIKDGLGAGTITADSAAAKRRINKEWGVPAEINEETNNQVQAAEEEWLRFLSEQERPAVCLRGDDHQIHFKTHQLSLQQPEAKQLLRQAGWTDCKLALWGWEDQYKSLVSAEAFLKQKPPGPEPAQPPVDPATGVADPMAAQQAQADWQQQLQLQQMIQALPKAPELRVEMIWTQTLMPLFGMDQNRWPAIQRLIQFMAHAEGHFQIAQEQSMAAQQGMPIPAAPGGVETQTGNIPGNPVMAFPGAGAGPGATTASGDGNA